MTQYVVLSEDIHGKWFIAKETNNYYEAVETVDNAMEHNKQSLIVDTIRLQVHD